MNPRRLIFDDIDNNSSSSLEDVLSINLSSVNSTILFALQADDGIVSDALPKLTSSEKSESLHTRTSPIKLSPQKKARDAERLLLRKSGDDVKPYASTNPITIAKQAALDNEFQGAFKEQYEQLYLTICADPTIVLDPEIVAQFNNPTFVLPSRYFDLDKRDKSNQKKINQVNECAKQLLSSFWKNPNNLAITNKTNSLSISTSSSSSNHDSNNSVNVSDPIKSAPPPNIAFVLTKIKRTKDEFDDICFVSISSPGKKNKELTEALSFHIQNEFPEYNGMRFALLTGSAIGMSNFKRLMTKISKKMGIELTSRNNKKFTHDPDKECSELYILSILTKLSLEHGSKLEIIALENYAFYLYSTKFHHHNGQRFVIEKILPTKKKKKRKNETALTQIDRVENASDPRNQDTNTVIDSKQTENNGEEKYLLKRNSCDNCVLNHWPLMKIFKKAQSIGDESPGKFSTSPVKNSLTFSADFLLFSSTEKNYEDVTVEVTSVNSTSLSTI